MVHSPHRALWLLRCVMTGMGVQEAMRVRPVAATGSTRYTRRAMCVGGHFLPKGTMVDVPFYAVRSPPLYACRCTELQSSYSVRHSGVCHKVPISVHGHQD